MKFKRLATILMAAAMMVSLVACTGDNGENSETPVTSGNDVVEETETNHITLAESWGFENFYTISKQFLDLTLCNSANGGKACIYGLFRHLLYGRTIRI